jgi:methionyl-tRNA formyltransferase
MGGFAENNSRTGAARLLNVHYSLLPKYRGAAPAAWTIINGEPKAGVTTMRLVERWMRPVYLQESIAVAPDETSGSLQTKLTPIGSGYSSKLCASSKKAGCSHGSKMKVR